MVEKIQKKVDDFIKSTKDGYWPPLSMLAALIEEIGESARIINSIEKIKPLKNEENTPNQLVMLEEELGDVLFALVCLANYYNISLENSIMNTLVKYRDRK